MPVDFNRNFLFVDKQDMISVLPWWSYCNLIDCICKFSRQVEVMVEKI